MTANDDDRVRPMLTPPHLGELIRESMDDVGWTVGETAARLHCERGTLSRVLNGKAGVSAKMALALEELDWGTADHWMRMQAAYELAQARRQRQTRGQESTRGRGTAPSPHPEGGSKDADDTPAGRAAPGSPKGRVGDELMHDCVLERTGGLHTAATDGRDSEFSPASGD